MSLVDTEEQYKADEFINLPNLCTNYPTKKILSLTQPKENHESLIQL